MVLFVYVDNSNVWIEGQHIETVRLGLAADPPDAGLPTSSSNSIRTLTG